MRERPIGIHLVCLLLLGNIAYLLFCWFAPQLCARLISSDWPILIKMTTVDLVGAMTGGFELRSLVLAAFLWQVCTLIGVWSLQKWSRRSVIYILVVMIVWGTLSWKVRGSVESVQGGAEIRYNGYILQHYFSPMEFKYHSLHGYNESAANDAKNVKNYPKKGFSYQPFCEIGEHFDFRTLYTGRHELKQNPICVDSVCFGVVYCGLPNQKEFSSSEFGYEWYWPYWTLFRVARDANDIQIWLGTIIWSILAVLVFLWFVFIPACVLYYLSDPQTAALFGIGDEDKEASQKRIPFWLFVSLIVFSSHLLWRLYYFYDQYYLLAISWRAQYVRFLWRPDIFGWFTIVFGLWIALWGDKKICGWGPFSGYFYGPTLHTDAKNQARRKIVLWGVGSSLIVAGVICFAVFEDMYASRETILKYQAKGEIGQASKSPRSTCPGRQ